MIATLASDAINGFVSEREARWSIVRILNAARIVESVVGASRIRDRQVQIDVESDLRLLLIYKCVGGNPDPRGTVDLDLARSVESSACGWARQLLRKAILSTTRNVLNRQSHDVLVDPTLDMNDEQPNRLDWATKRYHAHSAEHPADGVVQRVLHEYLHRSAGTRGGQRVRLSAIALLSAFDLPSPTQQSSWLDREWLRLQIEADPHAAHKSLLALDHQNADVDPRLAVVWATYCRDDRRRLTAMDPRVAHTIVRYSCMLLPRPSALAIRATQEAMSIASSVPGWEPECERLLASWLAAECEPHSDWSPSPRTFDNVQRTSEALDFPDRLVAAAQWPGQPLGGDPAAVVKWIRAAIESLNHSNPGEEQ